MTTPWTIQKLWQGQTVAVLGSGPSMNQDVADALALRQYRCIAVNHEHRRAPWADMLVAMDLNLPLWFAARHFAGMKVCGVASDRIDALYAGPMYEKVKLGPNHNIEIHNSGLAAIRIAAAMGAARIILAGFDPDLAPGRYIGLKEGLAALVSELRGRGILIDRYAAVAKPAPLASAKKGGAGRRRRKESACQE